MNWKTLSPLTILVIIIVIMLGTVGVIWAFGQITINGTGSVVASDAAITVYPQNFDWGPITQGTTKNITITLTNTGGTPTLALLIATPMPDGLSLTYDSAAPIPAHDHRDINFTLTVSPLAPTGAFTHTVTIDG